MQKTVAYTQNRCPVNLATLLKGNRHIFQTKKKVKLHSVKYYQCQYKEILQATSSNDVTIKLSTSKSLSAFLTSASFSATRLPNWKRIDLSEHFCWIRCWVKYVPEKAGSMGSRSFSFGSGRSFQTLRIERESFVKPKGF